MVLNTKTDVKLQEFCSVSPNNLIRSLKKFDETYLTGIHFYKLQLILFINHHLYIPLSVPLTQNWLTIGGEIKKPTYLQKIYRRIENFFFL